MISDRYGHCLVVLYITSYVLDQSRRPPGSATRAIGGRGFYLVRRQLRSVPAEQIFFQPRGNTEDEQHHHEDQKNQREHQSGVVSALGKRQEIAEPAGPRDELADNN